MDIYVREVRGRFLVPRQSSEIEPQRRHHEVAKNAALANGVKLHRNSLKEGRLGWWLQGNEVGRQTRVFDGEMVKRYKVIWGRGGQFEGNTGAGRGEGFIEALRDDDEFIVLMRTKVCFQ